MTIVVVSDCNCFCSCNLRLHRHCYSSNVAFVVAITVAGIMAVTNAAVVRRSSRARAAPEVYKPAWAVNEQGRMSSVEEEVEETREGQDFQAELPAKRARLARIPPEEQAWLQPPILTGACTHPPNPYTHAYTRANRQVQMCVSCPCIS